MKIIAVNTESVPIGTKVTFYCDEPDVDVLSALAHIRTTNLNEGSTDGKLELSGSLDAVDGAGEIEGKPPHAAEAAVGGEDTVEAVEPEPKTRSRRSRNRSSGAVGADADASSEQAPVPEEKTQRRTRRSRSKPDEEKGSEGSDGSPADAGGDGPSRRTRGGGGREASVTPHMTAEDLMKAAGEAADSIGPSAVMDIITSFGHRSASDFPADKRAEVAAKLLEACK